MTGYRTYIAAALVGLGGIVAQTDWISFMANPKAGAVAIGSAILMMIMRTITSTPPASKS